MRTASANTSRLPKTNPQLSGKQCLPLSLVAILLLSTGCTLCAPGYLCDYAGVGGKWQRSDPENGRVGSIFSDPNSVVAASHGSASHHPAEAASPIEIYPEALDQSILEPSMGVPADEGGVIILGEDW